MPCRIFHVYMAINVKNRHVCASVKDIRKTCCEIVASGHSIKWVESAKYLDIYLINSTRFKCSFSNNKAGFLRLSIVFMER